MIALLMLAASLHANVIFEERPLQSVCKDGEGWVRHFEVPHDCSATVEIMKILGVTREHRGEARLWLDDTLLGPLRKEFTVGGWESVQPVFLSKGRHELSIECGDQTFQMEGVRIGTPEAKASVMPTSASPENLTRSSFENVTEVSKGEEAPFIPFQPCPGLVANTEWPRSDPGHGMVLSVFHDRAASTGVLAVLHRGQRVRWWFKISAGDGAIHFPPLLLSEIRVDGEVWAIRFGVDPVEMGKALARRKEGFVTQPRGYRPGEWTPIDLGLCEDGQFHLATNDGEVKGSFQIPDSEMKIEVWSRGIEFAIRGEP